MARPGSRIDPGRRRLARPHEGCARRKGGRDQLGEHPAVEPRLIHPSRRAPGGGGGRIRAIRAIPARCPAESDLRQPYATGHARVLSATARMIDITPRDSRPGDRCGINLGINLRSRPRLIPWQTAPPPLTTATGGSPGIPDFAPRRGENTSAPRGCSVLLQTIVRSSFKAPGAVVSLVFGGAPGRFGNWGIRGPACRRSASHIARRRRRVVSCAPRIPVATEWGAGKSLLECAERG